MSGVEGKPSSEVAHEQAEAIAFLGSGAAFGEGVEVERHDTHGAMVFLGGDIAIKIKRAVRFSYMDFSSLEKRRAALARELEVNRANAPEIYFDVVPVTRAPDGRLQLGGEGEAIEWGLRMRRFEQSALLSRQLAEGLDAAALKAVADEVVRSHGQAAPAAGAAAVSSLEAIVAEIAGALRSDPVTAAAAERFRTGALGVIRAVRPVIEKRAAAGKVRRCHGDLHLDNIVIIGGRPRLFDAIEFDETLATVDMLYDLAFLLMDLDVHGYRGAANEVANRYLWKTQDQLDLEGLAALPLFLALRAGVRALVGTERAGVTAAPESDRARGEVSRYLGFAEGYLRPPSAVLVAVGGLSGTGKSTLAAGLSPRLGPSPGAVRLRSDLERKALHGVDELARLPDEAYSADESRRVYEWISRKTDAVLRAGHAVVADAVFAVPAERDALERLANACGVRFVGIWLEAGEGRLMARVAARAGDASDATVGVVRQQLDRGVGLVGWHVVDANGSVEQVLDAALAIVGKEARDCLSG